jgi:D-glycero-D-manno-heptose 1,7-bisphosphate phosphatase
MSLDGTPVDRMAPRAVFLDRDGVLNRALVCDGRPYPPASSAEFEILDEAGAACSMLKQHGFLLLCVTNQPDIARGTADRDTVDRFNDELRRVLGLDDIFVCPHDDSDACSCRKPKPGMLLTGAEKYDLDLTSSFMVGDRWRDIAAGQATSCRTVFIDRGYRERPPVGADYVTTSVLDAAKWILNVTASARPGVPHGTQNGF